MKRLLGLFVQERSLAAVGMLGLVLGAFCAVVMLLRGSAFIAPEGDLTKAITFNAAVGIYILTLALYAPLATFSRRGRAHWRGWTIGLTLYGYGIETIQAFRGLDPRFSRYATATDGILGGVFFLVALGLIVAFIVLALKLFRGGGAQTRNPLLLLAMRYGSVTTMLAFAAGIWMSAIQGRLTGANGNILPLHALGFHGLQAVPLIALLLARSSLPHPTARRWIHTAGITWLGACIMVAAQTALGRSMKEMSLFVLATIALLITWGIVAVRALATQRRVPLVVDESGAV